MQPLFSQTLVQQENILVSVSSAPITSLVVRDAVMFALFP